jgi:uncharacterized tellurite resistance protein B-like protein
MFKAINQFFQQLSPQQQQQSDRLSVEVATAALLFEIMRADDDFDDKEQVEVRSLLKKQFTLTDEKVEQMIKQAEQEAFDATDYHQFTRLLCEQYSIEQRMGIVESLWYVANADGNIDANEEHLIRRLSDLLRLHHSEFIQCKLKVLGGQA